MNLIHFLSFVYFMMYLIKKIYTKLEHQHIHKIGTYWGSHL